MFQNMKALKFYKEQSYDCWMLPSCEKSQIIENWTVFKEQKKSTVYSFALHKKERVKPQYLLIYNFCWHFLSLFICSYI